MSRSRLYYTTLVSFQQALKPRTNPPPRVKGWETQYFPKKWNNVNYKDFLCTPRSCYVSPTEVVEHLGSRIIPQIAWGLFLTTANKPLVEEFSDPEIQNQDAME